KGKIGNKGADALVFCLYLALTTIGVVMVYTVGKPVGGYSTDLASFIFTTMVGKQAIWVLLSLAVFLGVFLLFDERLWRSSSYIIYGGLIGALVLVLLFGTEIKGAKSWFRFAGFTIQPSELAKFGTCLAMATYLNTWSNRLRDIQTIGVGVMIWLVPALLILLQPDAGSALVFTAFLIPMYREGLSPLWFWLGGCLIAGFLLGILFNPASVSWYYAQLLLLFLLLRIKLKWYYIVAMAALAFGGLNYAWLNGYFGWAVAGLSIGVVSLSLWYVLQKAGPWLQLAIGSLALGIVVTFGANYFFNEVLQPHQQDRINVWLRPSAEDGQGAGYNVAQSKLAMASGGVGGKGIGQGTMTRFGHVPEQETDFIFSALGEEHGFMGVALVLILYFWLLYRITQIAERQRFPFHRAYAYGVAGILFLHLLVNVGMVMGLMPVIGIPLPFLSKGGSSLLGFSIMLAVLLKLDKFREQV
ncbi:MAG: rod shape-determining protein RodA, partial [Bacteroidota bacterium]